MNERDIFVSALEIDDPKARRAHLQSACADDPDLLRRVESLLASHEVNSRFLETPVVEQLEHPPRQGPAATIVIGKDSTRDESPDADNSLFHGNGLMPQNQDNPADEIPLGFLQPPTRPGSLGRLSHYEILEVLGHGAFGTVFKAFDDKLQRVVAIKVMAPELAATSPARKRFLREARASAAIRHEYVVSVYAVEETPIPYLVMGYVPGQTLQKRLDERGPLEVLEVLRLGTQIAEGLAAAHAKDLIHRDIKPGNILLETGIHDRVKITDFGLARAADDASMTQSGMIAGTPMYMAPEQALGHKLDQRADLFSFGSVLYQMVSGRPPFRAPTTLAVLKRVTEETPRPISEIIPETPAWLCDIISKLHAKSPDDRYQSARSIADVLANCEAQLKAHSELKEFSLIPRAKSRRMGAWKWVVAAVLVLPLVAYGAYTLTHWPQPKAVNVQAGGASAPASKGLMVESATDSGWHGWPADAPPPAIVPFDAEKAMEQQAAWAKQLGSTEVQNLGGEILGPGQRSSWSPDGKKITFGRSGIGDGILIYDLATKKTTEFAAGGKDPAWAGKDGHWIAYVTGMGNGEAISVAEVPAGKTIRIGSGCLPWWSADGKTLFFQDFERKKLMSTEVAAGGSFSPPGVRFSPFSRYPAVSPDGMRVASISGDNLILQQINDGKVLHRFVLPSRDRYFGGWSRDGQEFGFGGRHDYDSMPCQIIDLKTAMARQVSSAGLTMPAWSPDGTKITFDLWANMRSYILMVDAQVIKRLPIFRMREIDDKTGEEHVVASPDAQSLARLPAVVSLVGADGKWKLPPGAPSPAVAPFDAKKAKEHQEGWAKHLGVPFEIANSIGMKLVLIPPGEFQMGSPKELIEEESKTPGREDWYRNEVPNEVPQHRVRITKPFYLGMHLVTQEEYQRVMDNNPSFFCATGDGKGAVAGQDTERFPVENVTWYDVVEFCRKLSNLPEEKAAERTYRLPSEAQWEFACRAGSAGRYGFSLGGNMIARQSDENGLSDYGWFKGNAGGRTHAVGLKRASAWGLYDMQGNVWEWCQDSYDKEYYAKSPVNDPDGPPKNSKCVNRGGSWNSEAWHCRSAKRGIFGPGACGFYLGFRVSLVLTEE